MTTRVWFVVRRSRCVTTFQVEASSKKEAQTKFDKNEGEALDCEYHDIGRIRVTKKEKK